MAAVGGWGVINGEMGVTHGWGDPNTAHNGARGSLRGKRGADPNTASLMGFGGVLRDGGHPWVRG